MGLTFDHSSSQETNSYFTGTYHKEPTTCVLIFEGDCFWLEKITGNIRGLKPASAKLSLIPPKQEGKIKFIFFFDKKKI